MNLTVKQEFLLGIGSVICVTLAIFWYVFQFYSQQAQLVELGGNPTKNTIANDTQLTLKTISHHSSEQDCWIIIEKKVYDITTFLSRHPGGAGYILPYCGGDATGPFLTRGGRGPHSALAFKILGLIYLGNIDSTITHQPDTQTLDSLPIRSDDDD